MPVSGCLCRQGVHACEERSDADGLMDGLREYPCPTVRASTGKLPGGKP